MILAATGHHGVSCTRTVVASRVEGQRTAVMSSDGIEGVADVGSYGAQWQVRRRPVPARSTALELLPQRPAWVRTRGGGAAMPLTVARMAPRRPSAST
jgi:hypothetical protein